MKRLLNVMRIHTTHGEWLWMWPLAVLLVTFLFNVVIITLAGGFDNGSDHSTGGLVSTYIFTAIGQVQSITQLFSFAVGLSVTRRAFYIATSIVVLVQSAVFGLLLTVLKLIEQATGGWGVRLAFFRFFVLTQDGLLAQWAAYTVPFIGLSSIAIALAAVFKRWGQAGVVVTGLSIGIVISAAVAVITWQNWWLQIGAFFVNTSTLALQAGYPLVIAALAGGAGWLVLRRAAP